MRYDRILRAIADGEVDAGLIIHESRFTYADHGLVKVVDLGDWWEKETGLPVPLAGICARADLDDDVRMAAERAIRASVQYAFDHPEASREYVRAHAQEMSDEVCAQHIALYVNQHSLDIGDDGLRAVARLVEGGRPDDRLVRRSLGEGGRSTAHMEDHCVEGGCGPHMPPDDARADEWSQSGIDHAHMRGLGTAWR